MPQIIERGYLYIAQPPLYKYKKGKVERYLRDDRALQEYLADSGMNAATIVDANNHSIDRQAMQGILSKVSRYSDVLNMASRRRARDIIEYFVQHEEIGPESFRDEASALKLRDQLIAALTKAKSGARVYADGEVKFDENLVVTI